MDPSLINLSTLPLLLAFFFVLKHMGIIRKEWAKPVTFVGFNIGLTTLIFLAFLRSPIESAAFFNPFIGFFFALSLFLAGLVLVRVLSIPENKRPVFITSLVTLEGGAIGYPFFVAIFGAENIFHIALLDLGMAIFAFTVLALFFYRAHSRKQRQLGEHFLEILKLPLLWAMTLGLVLHFLGFNFNENSILEGSLLRFMETISAIAIPLILMGLVLNLNIQQRSLQHVVVFSIGSIAVTAILAYVWSFAWNVFPFSPLAKGALFVMSLLPPSFFAYVLADNMNLPSEHKDYAGQLFSVTVLISIVLLLIIGPFIPQLI